MQIVTGPNSRKKKWAGTTEEDLNWESETNKTKVSNKSNREDVSATDYTGGGVKKGFHATNTFLKSCFNSPSVVKAMGFSDFISDCVTNIGRMFYVFEKSIYGLLGEQQAEQEKFYRSLGKALSATLHKSDELSNVAKAVEENGLMVKAIPSGGYMINKSAIPYEAHKTLLNALEKGVVDQALSPTDVINYETNGILTPNAKAFLGIE